MLLGFEVTGRAGRPVAKKGEILSISFRDIRRLYRRKSERESGLEKKGYREILEGEASKHGVRVFYHSKGAQWGRAALGSRRIFVPRPARFTSFFTGLHELGHIMSNHHAGDGKPEYIWEFEAFTWAVHFCKNRGITVPARIVKNERDIIAEKLKEQVDSGVEHLDPVVVRFVKDGDDDDPDVEFVRRYVSNDGKVLASKPRK